MEDLRVEVLRTGLRVEVLRTDFLEEAIFSVEVAASFNVFLITVWTSLRISLLSSLERERGAQPITFLIYLVLIASLIADLAADSTPVIKAVLTEEGFFSNLQVEVVLLVEDLRVEVFLVEVVLRVGFFSATTLAIFLEGLGVADLIILGICLVLRAGDLERDLTRVRFFKRDVAIARLQSIYYM
jgi:hypothetical protein